MSWYVWYGLRSNSGWSVKNRESGIGNRDLCDHCVCCACTCKPASLVCISMVSFLILHPFLVEGQTWKQETGKNVFGSVPCGFIVKLPAFLPSAPLLSGRAMLHRLTPFNVQIEPLPPLSCTALCFVNSSQSLKKKFRNVYALCAHTLWKA